MIPDGMLEPTVGAYGETGNAGPAGRVDRVLDMLRAHLLERTTRKDWNERHAHEVAQAIVTCMRQIADFPVEVSQVRDPRLSRERLRRAVKFINENLDSKLDWERLAGAVGLPKFTFGRSFRSTTGLTPRQYVIRRRIRRSMRLLSSSNQSIADIALDVGCSCQSHLTTMFRKHTGITPGMFRKASK